MGSLRIEGGASADQASSSSHRDFRSLKELLKRAGSCSIRNSSALTKVDTATSSLNPRCRVSEQRRLTRLLIEGDWGGADEVLPLLLAPENTLIPHAHPFNGPSLRGAHNHLSDPAPLPDGLIVIGRRPTRGGPRQRPNNKP